MSTEKKSTIRILPIIAGIITLISFFAIILYAYKLGKDSVTPPLIIGDGREIRTDATPQALNDDERNQAYNVITPSGLSNDNGGVDDIDQHAILYKKQQEQQLIAERERIKKDLQIKADEQEKIMQRALQEYEEKQQQQAAQAVNGATNTVQQNVDNADNNALDTSQALERAIARDKASLEKKEPEQHIALQEADQQELQTNKKPTNNAITSPKRPSTQQDQDTAKPIVPRKGPWRVQFAALTSVEKAEGFWQKFSQKYARYLQGLEAYMEEIDVNGRVFYRVQASGLDNRNEARNTCQQIIAAGGNCIVRVPLQ